MPLNRNLNDKRQERFSSASPEGLSIFCYTATSLLYVLVLNDCDLYFVEERHVIGDLDEESEEHEEPTRDQSIYSEIDNNMDAEENVEAFSEEETGESENDNDHEGDSDDETDHEGDSVNGMRLLSSDVFSVRSSNCIKFPNTKD